MKFFYTITLILFAFFNLNASVLIKIDIKQNENLNIYFDDKNLTIHYCNNAFIIATAIQTPDFSHTILDKTPWEKNENYFILKYDKKNPLPYYMKNVEQLFSDNHIMIVNISTEKLQNFQPLTNDGVVPLKNDQIKITQRHNSIPETVTYIEQIAGLIDSVDIDLVFNNIRHLQNYGTRKALTPEAILAQNWLYQQFESYGLDVELQDFTFYQGNPSDNVIAKQIGYVYPDEYIVIGGHYDSYTYSTLAPGADDNASGTCAVLEIARILSQFQFNRTIIYCAFSAEEYGLYGSADFVARANANNMNIVGYLNLDMIGYRASGENLHTDMIAPSSANQLVNYYKQIVNVYVDDFVVNDGHLVGGDSDHTSFNNGGIQGIFPAEEDNTYSPYIHTTGDTLITSVNSPEKAQKFIEAGITFTAYLAEMFNGLYPPKNLTLTLNNDSTLTLAWQAPTNKSFVQYIVYRNNIKIDSISDLNTTTYLDQNIQTGNTYSYYITAVYDGSLSGESYPSNRVSIEFGRITLFSFDFESGNQNWTILNTNLGWRWNVPVNLSGNNTKYLSIDSDEAGQGAHVFDRAISPILNIENNSNIKIIFDYGFRKLTNDYLKVQFRTSPQSEWQTLLNLAPITTFTNATLELSDELTSSQCQLAFYYDDENSWAWYAGIDNVIITGYENAQPSTTPTNLQASISQNAVNLSWNAPTETGVLSYNIYRNNTLLINLPNPETNQYIDNTVVSNNSYTYYVKAVYESGESNPSNQVTVNIPTSINSVSDNLAKIYPSPVRDILNIESLSKLSSIVTISDINGKILIKDNLDPNEKKSLILSNLKDGIYILQITNGKTQTKEKIIVQH